MCRKIPLTCHFYPGCLSSFWISGMSGTPRQRLFCPVCFWGYSAAGHKHELLEHEATTPLHIAQFEELTSSCSLLQLLSCSFRSCLSFAACRLVRVIFLSVSLLLLLWVSSKFFLSVTVAFLSLMVWFNWATCWNDKGTHQVLLKCTCQCEFTYSWLFLMSFINRSALYQSALLHVFIPLHHLLDSVFPLVDELLGLQMCLLQILCSLIQSDLFRQERKQQSSWRSFLQVLWFVCWESVSHYLRR